VHDERHAREAAVAAAHAEVLAVVGPSGAGKTTLGRCIAGLVTGRGRVEVDGRALAPAIRARRGPDRRAVQYVHQNPQATFREHQCVLDQVARPAVLLRDVPWQEALRDAEVLLARLGVDAATCSRRPGALSGGQLQRAAVARALVARPAVLDAGRSAELLAAIDALRREAGTTVVLISHDLSLVAAVADTVVAMDGGRIVEHVRPAQVTASRTVLGG
jgi:peptide/nickel transport system ATP-binding protein